MPFWQYVLLRHIGTFFTLLRTCKKQLKACGLNTSIRQVHWHLFVSKNYLRNQLQLLCIAAIKCNMRTVLEPLNDTLSQPHGQPFKQKITESQQEAYETNELNKPSFSGTGEVTLPGFILLLTLYFFVSKTSIILVVVVVL